MDTATLKASTHFQQGNTLPNMERIVRSLAEKNVLPEDFNEKNWSNAVPVIIDSINKYLDKSEKDKSPGHESIAVEIWIDYLTDFYKTPDADLVDLLAYTGSENLADALGTALALQRTAFSILNGSLSLLRFPSTRNRILYYGDSHEHEPLMQFMDIAESIIIAPLWFKEESHIKAKENLAKIDLAIVFNYLKRIKKTSQKITVHLELRVFLRRLAARIDVLSMTGQKENLLDKFEIRKEAKKKRANQFLLASLGIFGVIFASNLIFFGIRVYVDRTLNFDAFMQYFWGQNIYFFSLEIFLVFLAFYFLSLFRSYLKVAELYDAHMLLIESDFYYKNDPHFYNIDSKILFEMRKENTQKIHSLPEKTYDIFSSKSLRQEPVFPLAKILEELTDAVRNLKQK